MDLKTYIHWEDHKNVTVKFETRRIFTWTSAGRFSQWNESQIEADFRDYKRILRGSKFSGISEIATECFEVNFIFTIWNHIEEIRLSDTKICQEFGVYCWEGLHK